MIHTLYYRDDTTLFLVSPHPPLYGAIITSLLLSPLLLLLLLHLSYSLFPHHSFTKVGACIVSSIPLHPVVILFGDVQLNPVSLGVPGEKAPTLPLPPKALLPSVSSNRLSPALNRGLHPRYIFRIWLPATEYLSSVADFFPVDSVLSTPNLESSERRPFQSIFGFVDSRCIDRYN